MANRHGVLDSGQQVATDQMSPGPGEGQMRTRIKAVPVHVRRTISGAGEQQTDMSIFCRFLGRGLSVDDCVRCDYNDGLNTRANAADAEVACGHPEAGVAEPETLAPSEADRTPVAQIMTRAVFCVTPEVSVESLTGLLLERGFSGAPVVDDEGRPVGIVSKTDLLRMEFEAAGTQEAGEEPATEPMERGFHTEKLARATVEDVMTPVAFTVELTTSVSQAAALMAYEGVHRVPVVREGGQVVGLLSSMDVLRYIGEYDGYLRH